MSLEHLNEFEPFWKDWYIEEEVENGSFCDILKVKKSGEDGVYKALKVIEIPKVQMTASSSKLGERHQALHGYFGELAKVLEEEVKSLQVLNGKNNILSYESYEVLERKELVGYDIVLLMPMHRSYLSYISGKYLKDNGEIIQMAKDICVGLSEIHNMDFLHRDLKLENIYIDEEGNHYLGEIGLENRVSTFQTGSVKRGTYEYLAPEVYLNKEYSKRADVYSLGVVIYILCNDGKIPKELQRRDRNKELPVPCNARERLSEIIFKSMAYDAEERYDSAESLLQDLETLTEEDILFPFEKIKEMEEASLAQQQEEKSLATNDVDENSKVIEETLAEEEQKELGTDEDIVWENDIQEGNISESKFNDTEEIVLESKFNDTGEIVLESNFNDTGEIVLESNFNDTGEVVLKSNFNDTGEVVLESNFNGIEGFESENNFNHTEEFKLESNVNRTEEFESESNVNYTKEFESESNVNYTEEFKSESNFNSAEGFESGNNFNGTEKFESEDNINSTEEFETENNHISEAEADDSSYDTTNEMISGNGLDFTERIIFSNHCFGVTDDTMLIDIPSYLMNDTGEKASNNTTVKTNDEAIAEVGRNIFAEPDNHVTEENLEMDSTRTITQPLEERFSVLEENMDSTSASSLKEAISSHKLGNPMDSEMNSFFATEEKKDDPYSYGNINSDDILQNVRQQYYDNFATKTMGSTVNQAMQAAQMKMEQEAMPDENTYFQQEQEENEQNILLKSATQKPEEGEVILKPASENYNQNQMTSFVVPMDSKKNTKDYTAVKKQGDFWKNTPPVGTYVDDMQEPIEIPLSSVPKKKSKVGVVLAIVFVLILVAVLVKVLYLNGTIDNIINNKEKTADVTRENIVLSVNGTGNMDEKEVYNK